MTHVAHRVHYTFEEYIAFEDGSSVRHEYLDGQIYGMAGGSPQHGALKAMLVGQLVAQLQGGRCRVLDSDVRVRVLATGLATYPDASVVCGPWQLDPADRNTVVNPTVLVEVTSKSTEAYDRTEKLEHFRRIPSLREYLLVSHRQRELEIWRRTDSGEWQSTIARAGERAELRSIGCVLDVDTLYQAAMEPSA